MRKVEERAMGGGRKTEEKGTRMWEEAENDGLQFVGIGGQCMLDRVMICPMSSGCAGLIVSM